MKTYDTKTIIFLSISIIAGLTIVLLIKHFNIIDLIYVYAISCTSSILLLCIVPNKIKRMLFRKDKYTIERTEMIMVFILLISPAATIYFSIVICDDYYGKKSKC